MADRRPTDGRGLAGVAGLLFALSTACAVPATGPVGPVGFDTATVWLVQGGDSSSLLVEVARSRAQQERGLSQRPSLEQGSGMLFLFSEPRAGDDGFWMWRTPFPLDIAFLDRDGTVRRILSMEPCLAESADGCPGYFPEVPYSSALEVTRGWFDSAGLGVGARMRVVW